jgi:hypothetical protein
LENLPDTIGRRLFLNWEAASAVAEWTGVILVVVSLGYLAVQIRQNTRTVRASTELDTGRQWSEFHARIAHSPDMADIWDKGLTDAENLTEHEKRRFIWLVAEYLFLVESLYRQWQLGFLGLDGWNQHLSNVAGLLLHPLIESWWKSGVSLYSPEFRVAIDDARSQLGDAVWSYTPLSEL